MRWGLSGWELAFVAGVVCTATGDWIKILKICLRRAEQGVWFEGEAVGGTCKEGVVG